jgi:hypothetical protein
MWIAAVCPAASGNTAVPPVIVTVAPPAHPCILGPSAMTSQ